MFRLDDKRIVITGAASGIGRETAITASKLGATIIMVDMSETGLKETYSNLMHGNHSYYTADLTNIDYIADMVNMIVEKNGLLNGFVHCAGISSRTPLNVLTKEKFAKVMNVNFYSFVELVRQICKKKHFVDGGSVVAMSSISSLRGYKAKSEYCVSKAAVDAFIRCIALELAERHIRINSVMPSAVNTPMATRAHEMNTLLGITEIEAPLGIVEPYEVANTIVFLLSDATKTITGTSILIDGGYCI